MFINFITVCIIARTFNLQFSKTAVYTDCRGAVYITIVENSVDNVKKYA